MAYESTKVPPEKSQADLKKYLKTHGADAFLFGEEPEAVFVQFRRAPHFVKITVPLKQDSGQEMRRIWRVIFYNLKARMEAYEEGVETFEQAFLAHLVNPTTGRTVYEDLERDSRIELPGGMLAIEPGA